MWQIEARAWFNTNVAADQSKFLQAASRAEICVSPRRFGIRNQAAACEAVIFSLPRLLAARR
jgi:hypothetical protein